MMSLSDYRQFLNRVFHENVGIVATAAAVAASASFMWLTAPKQKALGSIVSLHNQSVEIEVRSCSR